MLENIIGVWGTGHVSFPNGQGLITTTLCTLLCRPISPGHLFACFVFGVLDHYVRSGQSFEALYELVISYWASCLVCIFSVYYLVFLLHSVSSLRTVPWLDSAVGSPPLLCICVLLLNFLSLIPTGILALYSDCVQFHNCLQTSFVRVLDDKNFINTTNNLHLLG